MRRLALLAVSVAVLAAFMPDALGTDALERVAMDSKRLANAFGEKIFGHVNVNQQVQVSIDIANRQGAEQPFVYILQIKDDSGRAVSINTITGGLHPAQSFNIALSWKPDTPGTYVAESFIWESLENADALARPTSLGITVG